MFFSYFAGWVNTFSFRFFPYIKNPKLNFWLNITLWMMVVMPILFGVAIAVVKAFDGLSKIPPK
jgi:hypothetical protein